MRDPICDFNSHSNFGLSGWFISRQEFYRVCVVKEFYKQPVCSKSDQWFRKHFQNMGNYRNGIPLVGLGHFFYPYVKKDFYKTRCYYLKTDKCCPYNVYFFNRNTPARHNGDNNEHIVFDRFILHYCIYPEDKTSGI